MPNAYILNDVISPSDKVAIDSRIVKSGFSPIHGSAIIPTGITISSDIIIVSMPIDSTELASITPTVKACGLAGARVIGIWLAGAAGAALPICIKNYGYSAICLTSAHFDNVMNGKNPSWENSDCSPRDIQDIPRNRC